MGGMYGGGGMGMGMGGVGMGGYGYVKESFHLGLRKLTSSSWAFRVRLVVAAFQFTGDTPACEFACVITGRTGETVALTLYGH